MRMLVLFTGRYWKEGMLTENVPELGAVGQVGGRFDIGGGEDVIHLTGVRLAACPTEGTTNFGAIMTRGASETYPFKQGVANGFI